MAIVVGGLRARLVRDSLYHMLYDSLAALGWFNTGRRHSPIIFTGDLVDSEEKVEVNTIGLNDEDTYDNDVELGSNLTEKRRTFYVDFFAENNVVGRQLIEDVADILGGRMSSIGREFSNCLVYDYRQATPEPLFYVQLEDIIVDRAHDFPRPWQKHWFACRFDVVDTYGDDGGERDYDEYTYDSGEWN